MIFHPYVFPRIGRQWPPYNTSSQQAKGLAVWWPIFPSGGANNIRDFVGGNNGLFAGDSTDPTWVSSIEFDTVLDFDGSDDIVTYSNPGFATPRSTALWFNADTLDGTLIAFAAAPQQAILFSGNDFLHIGNFSNRLGAAISNFSTGIWYHVVIVYHDATTDWRIYVNGVDVTVVSDDHWGAFGFSIGKRVSGTAKPFNGRMFDIRIYNRALSAAEAYQMYSPATRWELYAPVGIGRELFITAGLSQAAAGNLTPTGALTRKTLRALSGALAPAGVLARKTLKALGGVLTPTGALASIKLVFKAVAGTLTPAGALVHKALKVLSGGLTPTGALASIKLVFQAVSGSLTPAGALTRKTLKALDGALTPVGVLIRKTLKVLSGGLTPTGALASIKLVFQAVSGSLTPAGALTRKTLKALDGALTPVGVLIRKTLKILDGGLTPVGDLVRKTLKALDGSLTPTGTLASVKLVLKAVAGSLTPAGDLTRKTLRLLDGALVPAGALVRKTLKVLSGGLTPTGALASVKLMFKAVAGTLTPAGALVRKTLKVLSGGLTPVGTLVRKMLKILSGGLTPVGDLVRKTLKALSGGLTPTGTLAAVIGAGVQILKIISETIQIPSVVRWVELVLRGVKRGIRIIRNLKGVRID